MMPNDPKDDAPFTLNVGDLRILLYWAERWARQCEKESPDMPKVVYAIAQRVRDQLPEAAKGTPLTMAEDFGKLKEAYPGAKMFDAQGNEIKPDGL